MADVPVIPTAHDGPVTVGPKVYGPPDQLATFLDNVAGLLDREPDKTFLDSEVRVACAHLVRMLQIRLDESSHGEEE